MPSRRRRTAAAQPRRVIAATDLVGGELVVCLGDAGGPVVARFPRTSVGFRSAEIWTWLNAGGA